MSSPFSENALFFGVPARSLPGIHFYHRQALVLSCILERSNAVRMSLVLHVQQTQCLVPRRGVHADDLQSRIRVVYYSR